jgi:hypothetical protein
MFFPISGVCNEQNPFLHLSHTQVSPANKPSDFKFKIMKIVIECNSIYCWQSAEWEGEPG